MAGSLFWLSDEAWTRIEPTCRRSSPEPVGLMIDG